MDAAPFAERIPRWLRAAWPWAAAVLSGVLLTLCYAPFDQGSIVWFALMPVVCATWFRGAPAPATALWRRLLRGLGPGYVTGFVFFGATFHWLGTLAKLYENPLLLSLPVLLALVFAFYVALWTWSLEVLRGATTAARNFPNSWRNLGIGASGACVWVALEWVRGWLFGGFGWNGLGVALHRDITTIQISDVTGVWGPTWLIIFVNLMSVIIVRRIIGELGPAFMKRVRWEFSISIAVVLLAFSYGVRKLMAGDAGPTVPLRVAAIQPNIPQEEKFDREAEAKTFRTLDELTALTLLTQPPPQLVIWPEACTPQAMYADEKNRAFVLDEAARGDFGLLIGTLDFDPMKGETYNVAALVSERGKQVEMHRKLHLVPFGEYLPLRPIFGGFLGQLVPGDLTSGTEFATLQLRHPEIKVAALICFEDTLGDLTRRFVQNGASVLVNITNDGWFAESPAAEQHLANAMFRAIETRRPLIRCGNTGVTGSIDAFGRSARLDAPPHAPRPKGVIPFMKPFQRGFVSGVVNVPTAGQLTFYSRHGDWLPHLSAALAIIVGIIGVTGSLRRKTPPL